MKRWKSARTAAVVVVAVAGLITSGCGASKNGGGQAGGDTSTLRLSAGATGPFTEQFNPFLNASTSASGYAANLIYEPLLLENRVNATTKPWLVDKYSWNDKGTELTLDLHPKVTWSDGSAFTGSDVAYTFNLMAKDKALNFNGLPIKSAAAPTATQTVVTFTEPAFNSQWYNTTPVQEKQWSAVSDPVKFTNNKPIGTGPYTLKNFTAQVITLTKNSSYWGSAADVPSTVQLLSYDSDSSAIAAMQGNQVDWIVAANTNPSDVTSKSPETMSSWSSVFGTKIYLLPNTDKGKATADPALRKAINLAVDRTGLAERAFGHGAQPVIAPPGLDESAASAQPASTGANQPTAKADPDAAKKVLQDAGYKMGSDGLFTDPQGKPVKMALAVPTTNPYGDWVRAGTMISDNLKQAGISVTVKNESAQAWRSDVALGDFDLALRASGGSSSLWDNLNRLVGQDFKPVGKSTIVNWERYASPKAKELLASMSTSEESTPAYKGAVDGLHQLFADDTPVVPLGAPATAGIWRTDKFTGWPSDSDPYALPNASLSMLEVIIHLKPKSAT